MTKNVAPKKQTPMMAQYWSIKNQHPNEILLYRLGDFYEMFGDDAKVASRVLNITLTSRPAGNKERIPLAGIPYHKLEPYVAKFLKAGYRLALCEQMEDPKEAKGLVKRAVCRILTAGTAIDSFALEGDHHNFLFAVTMADKVPSVAAVDISTGHFLTFDLTGASQLPSEIGRLAPAEILLPDDESSRQLGEDLKRIFPDISYHFLESWRFDHATAQSKICEYYKVDSLSGFGIGAQINLAAAGVLLDYIRDCYRTATSQLRPLHHAVRGEYLQLDYSAQVNLELVKKPDERGSEGTVFQQLNKCCTAMGSRYLQHNILRPLLDPGEISERYQAIEELLADTSVTTSLREDLKSVMDIERILGRLGCRNATPKDMMGLGVSLVAVEKLCRRVAKFKTELLFQVHDRIAELSSGSQPLKDAIIVALTDDPPARLGSAPVIRNGCNAELDRLRAISTAGQDWLVSFEQQERAASGIKSLKVKYNQVFGYYIEVTKANSSQVPEYYERRQTLVNAERYVTKELKDYEEEILTAEERALKLEERLYEDLKEQVITHATSMHLLATEVATLDFIVNLAYVARHKDWVRPQIIAERKVEISGGRHPIVEELAAGDFCPNDLQLGTESSLHIITGPNMAGKSTFIRQNAILLILAQIGSYVPAESMLYRPVDKIFTRIGASDNIAKGQSTFMVEMSETANILHNATEDSLVILDEIGRGTSTYDGLAIAWAVAEELSRRGTFTLFATHYFELTELSLSLSNVKNFNVAVQEWENQIIFLHKIHPGGTDRSYGIYVARLAGLPENVVSRSFDLLQNLEAAALDDGALRPALQPNAEPEATQLSLFTVPAPNPLGEFIAGVDPDNLSPREALAALYKAKEISKQSELSS